MALGEIYIKLVVSFPNDPKVRALARYGADAGLARDLYVQMCLYCKDLLSDGFVPDDQIGLLVYPLDMEHGKQLAKQLASVGLTKESSKDGASGWDVLAFLKRNGSREEVERLSEVRAQAGRRGGQVRPKRAGQRGRQANGKQVAKQGAEQSGSNAVSVSAKNASTDTQAPTEPAALTPTQRSKPITDAYHEAQPMCKWPAINGIVVLAIKSGKYTDDQIHDALLRMAETGQTVSVESLRLEIEGFTPRDRASPNGTSTGAQRAQQAIEAGRRVQAMLDGGTNP